MICSFDRGASEGLADTSYLLLTFHTRIVSHWTPACQVGKAKIPGTMTNRALLIFPHSTGPICCQLPGPACHRPRRRRYLHTGLSREVYRSTSTTYLALHCTS